MDAALEILLTSKSKISSFVFRQPEYEWDGVKYPQGPAESSFGSFKLVKTQVPSHVALRLPNNYKNLDWQAVSVLGKGENGLIDDQSALKEEYIYSELYELVKTLLVGEFKWVVVFEPDYDQIDEVKLGDIGEVILEMKLALTVKKKGFIIWGPR